MNATATCTGYAGDYVTEEKLRSYIAVFAQQKKLDRRCQFPAGRAPRCVIFPGHKVFDAVVLK